MLCDKDQYVEELLILKTIAENLNQSNDMKQIANDTRKLLDLTQLETGWLFLIGDQPHYDQIADVNLPPALSRDNKTDAMRRLPMLVLGRKFK